MNHRASVASLFFALLASSLPVGVAHADGNTRPLDLSVALGKRFPASSAAGNVASGTRPLALAAVESMPHSDPITDTSAASGRTSDDVPAGTVSHLVSREPYAQSDNCGDDDVENDNDVEVHGQVDVGVMAGSRVRGNYQSAIVNISKAFGDCDEPRKTLSITFQYGQTRFRSSRGGQ